MKTKRGRFHRMVHFLVRRIHLWVLKKRICDMWHIYAHCGVEEMLLDYETMKVYATDGMWYHPCGSVVDEGRDCEPSGEWECTCKMCCNLRKLITSNKRI